MNKWAAQIVPFCRQLAAVFFAASLCLILIACERRPHAKLDRYKIVEPLNFTNQRNQPVSLGDLRGKVWVASFIFTSCSIECAYLVRRLKIMQDKLASRDDVVLVSFSLDPKTDTPERLMGFARRHGEDNDKWHFLTGDEAKLNRIIKNTFYLPITDEAQRKKLLESNELIHRNHFAVVDKQGTVRFYVDGMLPEAEELVINAVQQLLSESDP